MSYANCSRCKSTVVPDAPSTLRRVIAWEKKATAASRRSASDVVLREPAEPAEYLCSPCSHAIKAGVAPLQQSFGEAA
jgi:DNA-directed RNA polymerase subunit RPC12/RpoP